MKYITILVFCFFYRGMCVLGTGGDRKNLLGLRSYPEDVQRIVHLVEDRRKDAAWRGKTI